MGERKKRSEKKDIKRADIKGKVGKTGDEEGEEVEERGGRKKKERKKEE